MGNLNLTQSTRAGSKNASTQTLESGENLEETRQRVTRRNIQIKGLKTKLGKREREICELEEENARFYHKCRKQLETEIKVPKNQDRVLEQRVNAFRDQLRRSGSWTKNTIYV